MITSGQSKLETLAIIDGILHWLSKSAIDDLISSLAGILLSEWGAAQAQAVTEAIRQLKKDKPDKREINAVLNKLSAGLGQPVVDAVAAPLLDLTQQLYQEGINQVAEAVKPYKPTLKLTFDLVDADAVASLQKFDLYWIGNFYDEQLAEQVKKTTEEWRKEEVNRRVFAKRLQEAFEVGEFNAKPTHYWQGLADHIGTRTTTFSMIEKMDRAKVGAYEFVARMDERTSTVCRNMNGRIFPLQDAIELKNKLYAATDPDEVKQITPWRKPEELEDAEGNPLPNDEIPADMRIPPLHFRCRSRIRPIFN
ncbi:MAG: hypothetical protein D6712_17840 [Chloroflexi bacterium]|nr:MAG: hypothetical protein D6712_17840 [Chloroflexota bacterium]